MNTETAQKKLVEYFLPKKIKSEPQEWRLMKKYKNHKGVTCRDFRNEKNGLKVIIFEQGDGVEVIENEDFNFFLKEYEKLPVFYYITIFLNNHVLFLFEPSSVFDRSLRLRKVEEVPPYKQLLTKKLLTLFPVQQIKTAHAGLVFSFHGIDLDTVISKLETNQMKYDLRLHDYFAKDKYPPVFQEPLLSQMNFEGIEQLSQDELIDEIFSIASNKKQLNEEALGKFKHMLKYVDDDEFAAVIKIASRFKGVEKERVGKILRAEECRRIADMNIVLA